jgi:hypothetical protein
MNLNLSLAKISSWVVILIFTLSFKSEGQTIKKNWIVYEDGLGFFFGEVKKVIEIFDDEALLLNNDSYESTFDKKGYIIESQKEFHGNSFLTKYSYKLNKAGKKTQVIAILGKAKTVYSYDINGNITKSILQASPQLVYYDNYQYDKAGDLIKCKSYFNQKLTDVTKYRYNKNHMLIEANTYHYGRLVVKTLNQYLTFDVNHNWTKMKSQSEGVFVSPSNDKRIITTIRKITYY